jgi:uncharacterized membrane protein YphA (DoxX/SURF4 family)
MRAVLAAVWLYEGLWCKVLRPRPEQRAVVAAALPGSPGGVLTGIGLAEAALGVWVLSGVRTRAAAAAQAGLLVGVTTGGLAFAAGRIRRPGRMLARNAALLALIVRSGRG